MPQLWTQTCDRCGKRYTSRQCKLVCENCGHQLDCSDLFIDWEAVEQKRRAHPTPKPRSPPRNPN